MRTTRGKPTLDRRVGGPDVELADRLCSALAHEEQVDRVTHGFHTYPAGLHPDAARDLVAAFPGRRVHDPFCGGGTTLVEAMLAGRVASGADLSPIARLVATARTRLVGADELTRARSVARRLTEAARHAPAAPRRLSGAARAVLEPWYAAGVAAELEVLRDGVIDEGGVVGDLLRAAFSSIVVKSSLRRSDTTRERVMAERPEGTTAVLFHKKVRELARRLEALAAAVPPGTPAPAVRLGSATDPWEERSVDLIVTSPPYPAVYDYLPIQDLRLAWLGEAVRGGEIGSRRDWRADPVGALERWRRDADRWMAQAAPALAPGGHLVVVIGDGLVAEGPIDALGPTLAAAGRGGLSLRAWASLARPDHARRSVRWEHVIALRR